MKSVKSFNQCNPCLCRQAGVIQTSYDIVKAHSGTLEVESAEGVGSEFVIQLPAKNNGG